MSEGIEWLYNFEAGNPDSFILGDDGGICCIEDLQTQLQASREECDQLKSELKKKKNRIGILNRSLRRLKKE